MGGQRRRFAALLTAGLATVVAGLPSAAQSGAAPAAPAGVDTAEGHAAEDHVIHDAATEARLQAHTRESTAASVASASAADVGTPDQIGQWGPVEDWPVVGINTAVLPNGKVLAYDSVGDNATETYPVQNFTRATVYDPVSGTHTNVDVDTGYNVFCSGFTHLTDGTVYLAGGNKDQQLNGIVQTHLFDPVAYTWTLGPNMAQGRWYPTVTALRNGEMLITSGGPSVPEVRALDGSLRALTTASLSQPLYPWMVVAPDGRAFHAGPDQTLRKLDPTGTGSWQTLIQRDSVNRTYGGYALYAVGKILVAGGGASIRTAEIVDINGLTPLVTPTASMAFGRRQHNLTVLADGSVLATGGLSSGAGLVDLNAGVYAAERWDPATGLWSTLASEQVARQYHSTALLLPDGRVLSAGGGICGTCDSVGYLAKNAQIFSPPYLFAKDGSGQLAPRPTIAGAPATVSYASAFAVTTPDAAAITKVAMVRLGAVTHSNNMEQRYVPLSFTAGAGSLQVTAPANASIAPPGDYMLILVNADGAPSVASMVNVANAAPPVDNPPTVQLTAPANGASFPFKSSVTITATAGDDNGVQKVEFFAGTTKLGEDTTAPYSFVWRPGPGAYTLTARAIDSAGRSTTSAGATVTIRKKGR